MSCSRTVPMAPAGYGDRVEGAHAVHAAARSGRVRRLWVEKGRIGRPEIDSIVELVEPGAVSLVEDVRRLATTGAPQGVLAECDPLQPVTLEMMRDATDAVMVLDHVEDPQNLGAVARSIRAAGVGGLVVSSRRSAPLSAAAFKAAAGALEELPVAVVGSIPEALRRLNGLGLWVVGLDAKATTPLFDLDLLTEPVALVVGAEGRGLARLVAGRCDLLVSVPMAAAAESLNASVTAALAAFEVMRVRSRSAGG